MDAKIKKKKPRVFVKCSSNIENSGLFIYPNIPEDWEDMLIFYQIIILNVLKFYVIYVMKMKWYQLKFQSF